MPDTPVSPSRITTSWCGTCPRRRRPASSRPDAMTRRELLRAGGLGLVSLAAFRPARSASTVEVRCGPTSGGHVGFDPIGILIQPGDTVRWDPGLAGQPAHDHGLPSAERPALAPHPAGRQALGLRLSREPREPLRGRPRGGGRLRLLLPAARGWRDGRADRGRPTGRSRHAARRLLHGPARNPGLVARARRGAAELPAGRRHPAATRRPPWGAPSSRPRVSPPRACVPRRAGRPTDDLTVITRPIAGDAGDSVPSAHEGGRWYTRSRTRAPPGTGEDAVRPWRRLTPGVRAGG
jgi:hypothetical protein